MNRKGISAMHDAILFIVMVSLSGAILLPAFINNPITESEIERERSETADEALIVLLSVTPDEMEYIIGEDIIKDALSKGGVDFSKSIFWEKILSFALGRTQYHKNYAELIAEDLASQFSITWGGENVRINLLTSGLERRLKENISHTLTDLLGKEYFFNFTAKWEPIIGIPFGGKICVGEAPPQAAYVSKTFISMPLNPVVIIGGKDYSISKNGIKNCIEDWINSVPAMKNILDLIENYENNPKFREDLTKNLEDLIYGFLFTGVTNSEGEILFPGIMNLALHIIIDNISRMVNKMVDTFLGSLNSAFGDDAGVINAIKNMLEEQIKSKFNLNKDLSTEKLSTALTNKFVEEIKNNRNFEFIKNKIEEYVGQIVDYIIENIEALKKNVNEVKNKIDDWLLNRISISRAEVSLAIWEA